MKTIAFLAAFLLSCAGETGWLDGPCNKDGTCNSQFLRCEKQIFPAPWTPNYVCERR